MSPYSAPWKCNNWQSLSEPLGGGTFLTEEAAAYALRISVPTPLNGINGQGAANNVRGMAPSQWHDWTTHLCQPKASRKWCWLWLQGHLSRKRTITWMSLLESTSSPTEAEATDIPHKHFDGNGIHGAPFGWPRFFGADGDWGFVLGKYVCSNWSGLVEAWFVHMFLLYI